LPAAVICPVKKPYIRARFDDGPVVAVFAMEDKASIFRARLTRDHLHGDDICA